MLDSTRVGLLPVFLLLASQFLQRVSELFLFLESKMNVCFYAVVVATNCTLLFVGVVCGVDVCVSSNVLGL
jgi:hypothetical protein